MDKIPVPTKSDTPDKAVGKATNTKITPEVKTKDGVSTQVESIGMNFARKFYQKENK